ncbi:trypsin-like serine protease [Nannocystaceae bacterium ST9]
MGPRNIKRSIVGLAALLALPITARAAPPELAPPPSTIVGGQPAQVCEWPQVAALTLGGTCTATLIHPRVLVYAAHCGTLHDHAMLGEQTDAPARTIDLLRCERASDVFAVSAMDFAFCELREPLDELAIAPLLFGCDEALIEVGTPVTIVGFGLDDQGGLGTKRVATTSIASVLSLIGIGGMGTGADEGDSGGPALVQLDDGSWRLLGIVSGGGGGGGVVQYVPAPVTVGWIEDRSGIDVTPCHAADGSWAPTPACAGFLVASEPNASWAESCPSVLSGPSSRCGPAFASEPIDASPPAIAIVEPASASELAAAPVELDVAVEAGDRGWGVREVRLELDGSPWFDVWQRQARDEVPPYEFAGMAIEQDGEHAIVAIAEDWAGNFTSSAPVLVQVGDASESSTESGDELGEDSSGSSDASGSSDDASAEGSASACRCDARESDPAWPAGLALALLAIRRRRRATT